MSVFDCSDDWPVCLFDFSFKSNCPNFFVFRVQEDLTKKCKDDYFNFKLDASMSKMTPSGPAKFLDARELKSSSDLLI